MPGTLNTYFITNDALGLLDQLGMRFHDKHTAPAFHISQKLAQHLIGIKNLRTMTSKARNNALERSIRWLQKLLAPYYKIIVVVIAIDFIFDIKEGLY